MEHSRTKYADNSGLNEKNDCVVRALSVAGGLEYSVAHRMMAVAGREPRHSTSVPASIRMLETFFPHAQRVFVGGKATMAQFAAAYPDGRWMVYTRNHAVALVDGVVYDWMPHPRSRVRWGWRLDKVENNIDI